MGLPILVVDDDPWLELISDARRVRPEMRAIVMSGYPRLAEAAPEIGWVSKRIDVDLLLTTLEG